MKTAYLLAGLMTVLAWIAILIAPVNPWIRGVLIAVLFLSLFIEFKRRLNFSLEDLRKHRLLPSSVITRYLCFIHLEDRETGRQFYRPVSRLDASPQEFRELKIQLQRFLISEN